MRVKDEHYHNNTDHFKELYDNLLRYAEHKGLKRRGVTVDTVDNGTRRGLIIEPHRQILRFFIYVFFQRCDYLVTADSQHMPAQSTETETQHIDKNKSD